MSSLLPRTLVVYLLIVNVATLLAFGADKLRAIQRRRRIRENTLLALSLAGGSLGGIIGMHVFRHKTRKAQFSMGLPLMLLLQAAIISLLTNF